MKFASLVSGLLIGCLALTAFADDTVIVGEAEYDRAEFTLEATNPRRSPSDAERRWLRAKHAKSLVAASLDGKHVLNHDDRSGIVTVAGGNFYIDQPRAFVRRDRE